MAIEHTNTSERERQWGEILVACLEAFESGAPLDRLALLSRHPEFAAELEDFLARHERIHQLAAPLRPPASGTCEDSFATSTSGATVAAATPPAPAAAAGAIAGYELLEEIGRGGMGVVYKARQRGLDRLVAVKMIRSSALASPGDVQRFRAEAETIAHLDHPHIVPVYEVGEEAGQHFFSMKLIDGGSLAQAVGSGAWAVGGKEAQRRAAQLTTTIARAVHHAHQRGVLHRDLKPANILLSVRSDRIHAVGLGGPDESGLYEPFITDFGLAKRAGSAVDLTHSEVIVGTPSYMAPEQTGGGREAITTATDVYGLGTILYALLAGRAPFRGKTPLETLEQVRQQPPPPPGKDNPQLDRDLETICLKCLEKEPRQRYGSPEALALDLERWLGGQPIQARPINRGARAWRWCRRNPWVAGLAAAVVLLLVVAVAGLAVSTLLIWQEQQRTEEARRQEAQQHRRAEQARAAQARIATYISCSYRESPRGQTNRRKTSPRGQTQPEVEECVTINWQPISRWTATATSG